MAEQALGAGVVQAVPLSRHALDDALAPRSARRHMAICLWPHPLGVREKTDLCQDFGHGSLRDYAAMGSPSSAGLVRSKKDSMACAGTW